MRTFEQTLEDQDEIDSIHDVLAGIEYGRGNKDAEFTNEQVQAVMRSLPDAIKYDGMQWGFGDTVVRDSVYEFLLEK